MLSEKLAILKEFDSFYGSKIELSKNFNFCNNTDIHFEKKDSIEKSCNDLGESAKGRKTLKISSNKENVLLKWYTNVRTSKIPDNGVIIKK